MPVIASQDIARSGSHSKDTPFFRRAFPHERSDMNHWRERFADKLDLLPAESLRVARGSTPYAAKISSGVTIDTTVNSQERSLTHSSSIMHRAGRKEPSLIRTAEDRKPAA